MLKHIFFDLYDTLAHIAIDEQAPQTAASFEHWLARTYGVAPAAIERLQPLGAKIARMQPPPRPHGEPDIAPVISAHLEVVLAREPQPAEVVAAAQAFRESSRLSLSLAPGAKEALAALGKRWGVGLISNTQALFTRPELEELGISHLLKPKHLSSDVGVRKPSSEIFALALRRGGLEPDEALMVGDHPVDDIQGAAAVGMRTCLIGGEGRLAECPVKPTLRCASVADLAELLLGRGCPAWV